MYIYLTCDAKVATSSGVRSCPIACRQAVSSVRPKSPTPSASAKIYILNAKFFVFDANFLVFETRLIHDLNAKFIIFALCSPKKPNISCSSSSCHRVISVTELICFAFESVNNGISSQSMMVFRTEFLETDRAAAVIVQLSYLLRSILVDNS